MGYTHHDAISITGTSTARGYAVGSATVGETIVITAAGVHKSSAGGAIPLGVSIAVPISADNTVNYSVAPIAGAVTGYVSWGVSTGTVHSVVIKSGSAGSAITSTGTIGVVATVGYASPFVAAGNDNTVTAGETISIHMADCATNQALTMAVLTFTPTV
jgi:hypothetical protein